MMVKWIKITTDIFDDEKIKIIDTMPARDEILVIWFKLLTLAGKVNQSGMLFLNSKIAYTPEMLAAIFNRDLPIIQLSLKTFENFGMIEVEENQLISISNWEKHQNIDGLDKIREQNRLRQQKHRENQRLLIDSNVTNNVTSHQCNALEEDKEKEIDIIKDIVAYLNQVLNSNYKHTTNKTKDAIKARLNEGYKLEDFKIVINKKFKEWNNSDMAKFLRPETLFGTKFESYLNQIEAKPQVKQNNFHNFNQREKKYTDDELNRKLGIRK